MKKKIFSASLLFALTLAATSTFVSCKDYDDDINGLQEQIDKLATKDELTSKISDMQAAIDQAKTDLTGQISAIQKVADAAQTSADAANKAVEELKASGASKSEVEAAQKAAEAAQKSADDAAKALADYKATNDEAVKAATTAAANAASEAAKANETLATLTGDEGAIAKAKAAAEAAQATADEAKAAAAKAQAAADEAKTAIDALNGEKYAEGTTLSGLAADIATIKVQLGMGDATGQAIDLPALAKKVDEIDKALQAIIGDYSTMVTSVSLFYDATQGSVQTGVQPLAFVKVTEKENVFGADTDKPFEFKEGDTKTYEASLIIRVNPTTADLRKNTAKIHLINSQGKELDDLVTCSKVDPYTELLTTRAAGDEANNGLWKVTFKLKDGFNPDDFESAVKAGDKQVLFAVAIKNTTESMDERRVISTYAVTLDAKEGDVAPNDFYVSNMEGQLISITDIHNRYTACEDKTPTTSVSELSWLDDTKPGTKAITEGSNKNAVNRPVPAKDNRQTKNLLSAQVNKVINIKVAWDNTNNKPAQEIRGFYVTLDKAYALESAPSEWNAWRGYDYENVGVDGKQKAHMFDGNEGQIMVKSDVSISDIIGFRVYAVNLDGTLLDPDGRSFYVVLGDAAGEGVIPSADILATVGTSDKVDVAEGMIPEGTLYQKASETAKPQPVADVNALKWVANDSNPKYGNNGSANADQTSPVFKVNYLDKDGKTTTDVTKIVNVTLTMDDVTKYVDGATYSQTCNIYDKNGVLVKTLTATATKVMPTEGKALTFWDNVATGTNAYSPLLYNKNATDKNLYFTIPAGMSIDANGKVSGASDKATFSINQVFKGLEGDANYEFSFSNSAYDAGKKVNVAKDADKTAANEYSLTIDPKFIDKAERTMAVNYLFKGISTTTVTANGKTTWVKGADYPVAGTDYSVTYRCWSDGFGYEQAKFEKEENVDGFDYKKGDTYHGYATWTSKQAGKGSITLKYINVTNSYADCKNIA